MNGAIGFSPPGNGSNVIMPKLKKKKIELSTVNDRVGRMCVL